MTAELDRIGRNSASSPAVPGAPSATDRLGQATAVEQARAVAEVAAAVRVAQEVPRNLQLARAQMIDSCRMPALAERAFFSYSRAGSRITGPSIHLARELARCFGNVQYGLSELRRDDGHGQSEMVAYAWDVQTNTRSSTTFIVPHGRDTQQGMKKLTDLRDIYENNANNGARRVREQIFAVLPPWFTEEAKATCRQTLEDGGGEPLAVRIDKMIEAFRGLGVNDRQLTDRLARRADQWTVQDVATLGVVFTSLRNGEASIEEEFPTARVTAGDIVGMPAVAAVPPVQPVVPPAAPPASTVSASTPPASTVAAPVAPPAVEPGPPAPRQPAPAPAPAPAAQRPAGDPITDRQLTGLAAALGALGYGNRDDKLRLLSAELGRQIESSKDMTKDEASAVMDKIRSRQIRPKPSAGAEPDSEWVPEPPADWQPDPYDDQAGAR